MGYARFAGVVLSVVAVAGVLTGCASGPESQGGGRPKGGGPDSAATTWFDACPDTPAGAGSSAGADSSPGAGTPRPGSPKAGSPEAGSSKRAGDASASPMPKVSLPCIRPGDATDFTQPLGVPTVVNVWASWCRPCREELPRFQSYADRVDGEVQVLGVVSGDTRGAAVALAKELDVRFPTLYDEKGTLIRSLGRTALPVTLFLDAEGRLVHLYNGQPLTERSLSSLVKRHLGVAS